MESNSGLSPEEIAADRPSLCACPGVRGRSLTIHANKADVDADIDAEARAYVMCRSLGGSPPSTLYRSIANEARHYLVESLAGLRLPEGEEIANVDVRFQLRLRLRSQTFIGPDIKLSNSDGIVFREIESEDAFSQRLPSAGILRRSRDRTLSTSCELGFSYRLLTRAAQQRVSKGLLLFLVAAAGYRELLDSCGSETLELIRHRGGNGSGAVHRTDTVATPGATPGGN